MGLMQDDGAGHFAEGPVPFCHRGCCTSARGVREVLVDDPGVCGSHNPESSRIGLTELRSGRRP
ncbi:MAG: hypothetical protein K0R99_3740 [Microbacterium sp.]|jgi:hypothetical protein|nr:hypothetical protein [Microbacterium sp.]